MLLAELEDNFVLLVKQDRLRRHKPTDYQVDLSRFIPGEVMQWSCCCLDFGDFIELIVVYVESVLSIIGLACGIIVCLQLYQELVGSGTEFDFDFFGLVDIFFIERLLLFVVKQQQIAFITLLIQKDCSQQVILLCTCSGNLQIL